LPQIRVFKIIQESLQLTRILVVSENGLGPDITKKIEWGFKARLGQNVHISIDEVMEIPAEKSGKFRYVESKITPIR